VQFNNTEFKQLAKTFANISEQPGVRGTTIEYVRQSVAFINDFHAEDVLKIKFRPESEVFWQISNESLAALRNDLSNRLRSFKFNIRLEFKRSTKETEGSLHSLELSYELDRTLRDDFLASIDTSKEFILKNTFPMFYRVPSITAAEVEVVKAMHYASSPNVTSGSAEFNESYSDWTMKLYNQHSIQQVWVSQLALNQHVSPQLETISYGLERNRTYVQIIAFIDRVFPEIVAGYVQTGIVAMYIAVVIIVARSVRGLIASQPLDVIINEIPNPDYLMKICMDIYLVREAQDFELEQDLFAKLIFLFRSPATLIKWTRQRHVYS